MLSGMIERWAFARRFVPHGGGYLYRPSLIAPAYFVSAQEREQSLALFKQQQRWRSLKIVGIVMVLIAVLASAAIWLDFDSSGRLPWWVTWGGVAAMVAIFWRQHLQQSAIPMTIIGQREPILPARGWLTAISAQLLARSWKAHLAIGVYIGALCWLFFPRSASVERLPWYPWAYSAVATLLIAQWIWISWAKATKSADHPPV